jgi:hypothetical protein
LGTKQLYRRGSKQEKSISRYISLSSNRLGRLLFSVLILVAALSPVAASAQSSISLIQRATFSVQPSSSGAVTLTLPQATGAGHALIVGVSFWPLDISSVTDSSGDAFTRGLPASIYHNVSQGVMYTNFYYAKSTAGGAKTLTLNFSRTGTYILAAVSEVAGLDPIAPLDMSAYSESLTSATPWSSAAITTSVANEYLFAWAADEWSNPTCSNPTLGWTESHITAGGATLCLADRTVSTAGSYQVSVIPAAAFNYGMEIIAFKGASSAPPAPAPLAISTATLPGGTTGAAYSTTLAATGGVAPYTWSAAGLPSGLLMSPGGTISGTPTVAGIFPASVTVMDSTNAKVSQSSTITIAAAAPPPVIITSSISVIQKATFSLQPSSSGTATLTLPQATGAGHALIVGVSFWPLDIGSVTDSSGDAFARGLPTSIYHNVSQGVMYTNFYYAKNTAGGAKTLTLNFSRTGTYILAAVSEVAGLDPNAPLDKSVYNESLTSTTPWSSASITTSVANEYLFAWAADEWTSPSCSNPNSAWGISQNTSAATICLVDRAVSAAGSYQASVTPSSGFNYAMEILAFQGASSAPAPAPLTISTPTLPGGTMGTAYSATLAASGGTSPYTWSAATLPAGLSITPSGTISGVPTAAGTQMASMAVKDSTGVSASASLAVTISSSSNNSSLPPRPATTFSLSHFGNAGFGGDDTNVFQTALNSTAANGQALEIPVGNYNVSPLTVPANSYLLVDASVTVTANSGYGTSDHLLNVHAQNVTIVGAGASTSVFHMRKAEYTSGEWRHCLDIENASNVTVSGISCNDSGGDGLYVSYSTNVTVQDSVFNNNRRQGSSITGGVNHIYYLRNHFTNTTGTAPQSGIDIEPNAPGDFLLDINIQDCYTDGNAGDGLMISTWLMDSTSQPIGINVLRHHSTGNQRYGYVGINADPSNAPGAILIQDSFSDQSGSSGASGRFYSANGASLTYQNLTVTNPHVNGPDPSYGDSAAVDIVRGGGGTIPLGNVRFLNINVSSTNGKVDRYFDFLDGSNQGIVTTGSNRAEFVPGTLSGATNAPPNGLVMGVGTNQIN